jgi:hypothetical protein
MKTGFFHLLAKKVRVATLWENSNSCPGFGRKSRKRKKAKNLLEFFEKEKQYLAFYNT